MAGQWTGPTWTSELWVLAAGSALQTTSLSARWRPGCLTLKCQLQLKPIQTTCSEGESFSASPDGAQASGPVIA